MKVINVIPSRRWRHNTNGRAVSIHSSCPWSGAKGDTRADWSIETAGWTWEMDNGTVGIGCAPAKTREEAEEIARKINAR